MQPHVKTYMKHFGHGEQDCILCEVCARRAVDVHHLVFQSQGGANEIKNLMALCRTCHDTAHASRLYNDQLKLQHLIYLENYE